MVFFNNELNDKIVGGLLENMFNGSKNTLEFDGVVMTNNTTEFNNRIAPKTHFGHHIEGNSSSTGLPELYYGAFSGQYNTDAEGPVADYETAIKDGTAHNGVNNTGFIRVVSDKYINTLNKIYKMLWAEEITEAKLVDGKKAFYTQPNRIKALVNLVFHDGDRPGFNEDQNNAMKLSNLVDRLIANGDLQEADKLDEYDSINLKEFDKTNCAVNIDTQARKVKLVISKPQVLDVLMDSTVAGKGQGKKYFIMVNPVLPTSDKIASNAFIFTHTYYKYTATYPFDKKAIGTNKGTPNESMVFQPETKAHANFPQYNRAPWVSFKGNPANEFYKDSIIMGSHVFFSIGTKAEYDLAPADNKPDIVFDHTDKISAIDKLEINLDLEDLVLESN